MAATLFRRTAGSGCLHRELSRVVWRPQAALFSSKPSDRKQPRRTHIKKAKPQPALDVSKLLEQLFSQRRPAGKARPTKPPSTSSVNLSSNVSTTSASCPATIEPSAEITETKAETVTADPSSSPAATVEPAIESPVEPFLSHVETLEVRAAAGERPVESTVDVTVDATTQEVETNSADSGLVNLSHIAEEPLVETTVEYPVEISHFPVETLKTEADVVEGPVDPTVDATVDNTVDAAAQEVETNSIDSGLVNLSHTEETLIETTVETLETRAAVGEGPVESAVQEVETNSTDSGLVNLWHTEEPLTETTIEAKTGSGSLPLENESTIESTLNVGVNGSEEMTDSVSEAMDAVEVQVAILVSDQRWRQALEATDQEAGNESRDESGDQQDLKAVSLEVQPSLESLESVSQTRAEAISGEKTIEVEVPEHRTEDLIGQDVKREDSLDDLDPIQRLFLDKIREYKDIRRLNGGQLVTDPGYEKYVSEETAKLQRLYGGGDLNSFPQFTFTELKMDQDSK